MEGGSGGAGAPRGRPEGLGLGVEEGERMSCGSAMLRGGL